MFNIQTLHTIDTEYSADAVEWCPYPQFHNYFVCGTYQLKEKNEENSVCSRKGRIYLYKFDTVSRALNEMDRLETAAILDMKWLKRNDIEIPLLSIANALGQIEVYALQNMRLKILQTINLNKELENLLTLSLDWRQKTENDESCVLASDSRGNITLLSLSNRQELNEMRSWAAHNFEAWICAFDKWDQNCVFSGGDDTFLNAYDLRTESIVLLNKSHTAGVTCLLSHPKREHILLTGSYDENLRIFDTRSMKRPYCELNLSGGIWRLKSHPVRQDMIVAACMYHNFSIVDIDELVSPKLIGEYYEHKSICYGADWCFNTDQKDLYMATCSFYDHKLCISVVENM